MDSGWHPGPGGGGCHECGEEACEEGALRAECGTGSGRRGGWARARPVPATALQVEFRASAGGTFAARFACECRHCTSASEDGTIPGAIKIGPSYEVRVGRCARPDDRRRSPGPRTNETLRLRSHMKVVKPDCTRASSRAIELPRARGSVQQATPGRHGRGGAGPQFGPSPSPYLAPAADPGASCDGVQRVQGLVSDEPKGAVARLGTAPDAVPPECSPCRHSSEREKGDIPTPLPTRPWQPKSIITGKVGSWPCRTLGSKF